MRSRHLLKLGVVVLLALTLLAPSSGSSPTSSAASAGPSALPPDTSPDQGPVRHDAICRQELYDVVIGSITRPGPAGDVVSTLDQMLPSERACQLLERLHRVCPILDHVAIIRCGDGMTPLEFLMWLIDRLGDEVDRATALVETRVHELIPGPAADHLPQAEAAVPKDLAGAETLDETVQTVQTALAEIPTAPTTPAGLNPAGERDPTPGQGTPGPDPETPEKRSPVAASVASERPDAEALGAHPPATSRTEPLEEHHDTGPELQTT